MIDALEHCSPEVRLVFAGSGAFQPELERRARERGCSERVHFLPSRPREELAEVMSALDALVLPSWTTARWKEQFGRVIVEAHACSIPVIGSTSGAIPDVVGRGGLVFSERDPRDLAGAIEALRRDPVERAAMGRVGRRQAQEMYSWQQVASRMSDLYRQLMHRPSSPAAPPAVPSPSRPVQARG